MANEKEYTAEDGLNLLNYLGITTITERERWVFRERWEQIYNSNKKTSSGNNRNFISTVHEIYSEVLPFTLIDRDRNSYVSHIFRDGDFGRRLDSTGVEDELEQGIPLEEILKKRHHKFILQIQSPEQR